MATFHWTNSAGGDFGTAANWSPASVPGSADDAIIDASGTYTVTASGSGLAVNSIQVTSAEALDITGDLSVSNGTGSGVNDGVIELTGAGSLTLSGSVANNDVVENNGSGQLTFVGATVTNGATLSLTPASVPGSILLQNTTVDNSSGSIFAGSGGHIDLDGATISGGTLDSFDFGGGIFNVLPGTSLLDGSSTSIDLLGPLLIEDGAELDLNGTISNGGTISIGASGHSTTLSITSAAVSLTGGGKILMSNDADNAISAGTVGNTLDNVNNTISGAGQISGLALTNEAGGLINANQSTALTITVASGTTASNAGTIAATGAGGLAFVGPPNNTGTIEAEGGNVTISGAVSGTGSAVIDLASTLEFTAASTANTTFNTGANGTLKLDASVSFTGSLTGLAIGDKLNLGDIAFGSGTTLSYNSGTGILSVSDGTNTASIALVGTYTASNFQTATNGGGGTLVTLTETNHWINSAGGAFGTGANWSLGTVPGAFDDALVDATGTYTVTGAAGTVHSLQLISGSTVDLSGNLTLTKGTGSGTNAGTISIGNGTKLDSKGSIDNSGTITLDSTGSTTTLAVDAASVTLTGGGQIVMSNDTHNAIAAGTFGGALDNVNNTISGAGRISGLALTNEAGGQINANQSTELTITVASGTTASNAGIIEATGAGGLSFTGPLNNTGTIEAAGGNVTISGAVSGTGNAVIDLASTLEFTAASTANTTFNTGANGTLKLDASASFTGSVTGFAAGDGLDLGDIAFGSGTTVSYDSVTGILSASDGAHTASIALAGTYAPGDFQSAADGSGGTLVKLTETNHWINSAGGAFGTGANWSLGSVPGLFDDALIDAVGIYTVTGAAGTVHSLQLISGTTLAVSGNLTVTKGTGSGTNAGTIAVGNGAELDAKGAMNNSGMISLASTGSTSTLAIDAASVTLSGGGQIVMSNNANNIITAGTVGDVLDNVNNTISGAGQVSGLALINEAGGLINANQSTALTIAVASGTTASNAGIIEATGSGGLSFTGSLSNSGTIKAIGGNVTIAGAVSGAGNAVIGLGSMLEFTAASTSNTTFNSGANGILKLDSSGSFSGSVIGFAVGDGLDLGDIAFGTGTTLSYNSGTHILSASDGTHTSSIALVGTYAAGNFQIAADGSGGSLVTLTETNHWINSAGGAFGTGANWSLGSVPGPFDDALIDAAGTYTVTGAAGTVHSLQLISTATLAVGGNLTVTKGTSSVTNAGTISLGNGSELDVKGTIGNSGTIRVASTGSTTTLAIDAANVTLSGGGQIVMSNNANNVIAAGTVGDVLENVNNTISGAGQISGLALLNDASGLINANQTTGLTIAVASGTTATNAGIIEATGVGGLSFTGALNNSGTIKAIGGNVTIAGAVSGAGSAVIGLSSMLEFTAASTANTTFNTGANGILKLDSSASFSGSVTGFATGDALDLSDITFGSGPTLSYNTGTHILSVSDGTHTAAITLLGTYTASIFHTSRDASGGTLVSYDPSGKYWINPAGGVFTTGSNWSGGTVPTSSSDAIIDLPGTYTVTGATGTVQSIQVGSGKTVTVSGTFIATNGTGSGANAATINVLNGGTFEVGGQVNNSGTINVGSTGAGTGLSLNASSVTLTGGGQIVMSNATTNRFQATTVGDVLHNVNNTISGAGVIQSLVLDNQAAGVINANQPALMTIGLAGTASSNAGLIEATGVGSLTITGPTTSTIGVLSNTGTVQNSSSGQTILVTTQVTNTGSIIDTGSSGILIRQDTIDNTGGGNAGTIQAIGVGAHVDFAASSISGGTLTASGGGVFNVTNATTSVAITTIDGSTAPVTIAGPLTIQNNDVLDIMGTINNTGTINVGSTGAGTGLSLNASSVTLTGGGQIVMSNATTNRFQATTVGDVLHNVNNTISGAGVIQSLVLDNQAAGVINANQPALMTIGLAGTASSNAGLIEATGVGSLTITGPTTSTIGVLSNTGTVQNSSSGQTILVTTQVTNTGSIIDTGSSGILIRQDTIDNTGGGNAGTIQAIGVGAHVDFAASSISGGTLTASGGGVFNVTNATTSVAITTIDGSTAPVTIAGPLTIQNNDVLDIMGTINNTGTITLNATGAVTQLAPNAASVTLTGGGQIVMSNAVGNRIQATTVGDVFHNVNNTISGAGLIQSLVLDNQAGGVINANQTGLLTIGALAAGSSNAGLIESTGAGGLSITSALSNTGTIAADGGNVTVSAAVSGAGSALVNHGSTLEFTLASTANTTFGATANNTLRLDKSVSFTGSLTGFATGDKLDLHDITFGTGTTISYSGSTLTVSGGGHTAAITLVGSYTAGSFHIASDGLTGPGTLVTYS